MKDRTSIGLFTYDGETGETTSRFSDIFYDDCNEYEDLPEPCRCDEIKKEFEIYKEWKRSLKVVEELEKRVGRFRG
uniref:Uncharacterized protein n=1 Tax=viral metagenome TaxID=1070528 RepID=A0A6H2A1H7_9ZZZZ